MSNRDKVYEQYTSDANALAKGDPGKVIEEMDAINGFLLMYQKDYIEVNDLAMANILGFLSDMVTLNALCLAAISDLVCKQD